MAPPFPLFSSSHSFIRNGKKTKKQTNKHYTHPLKFLVLQLVKRMASFQLFSSDPIDQGWRKKKKKNICLIPKPLSFIHPSALSYFFLSANKSQSVLPWKALILLNLFSLSTRPSVSFVWKKEKPKKNQRNIFFYKTQTQKQKRLKGTRHFSSILGPDRPIALQWSAGSLVQATNLYFLLHALHFLQLLCVSSRHFDHNRRRQFSRKRNVPVKKQIKKNPKIVKFQSIHWLQSKRCATYIDYLMPSCAVAAATSACVWCAGWNGWWLDTPSRHIRLYCPFPYPSHALFFVLFRFFCPTSVHLSRHIVGISFSFIDSTHSPPPRRDLCDAQFPRNPELFRPKQILKK